MKGSESKARHHVPPACAFGQRRPPTMRVNMWVKRTATGERVAIVRDLQPGEIGPTGKRLRALFGNDDRFIIRVQFDNGTGGDAA